MKVRQNVGGRSVAETVKSLAALILFFCTSMTMLFAQAPPALAQLDSSAAKFPADTRASEGNPYGEVAPTTQTSR